MITLIRVRQVKVPLLNNNDEYLKHSIAKKLHIKSKEIIKFSIHKQSLDARIKHDIFYVYEVDVTLANESSIIKHNQSPDIFSTPDETYHFIPSGTNKLPSRPVIIGSGPAGLFAAYLLAIHHYNPIIIERGESVEKRLETVHKFWETSLLNPNSNVQFGEGGAGTFSDGKLNTLVKDSENRIRYIYETFVKYGAPQEILYSYKPHIGTDKLIDVVKNMRQAIIKMGGEFHYNKTLTDLKVTNEKLTSIVLNHQEVIPCDNLILAIGHSARDTFEMLYHKHLIMNPKPFAIGLRVSHSQKMINISQYGEKYHHLLEAAPYKLTYKSSNNRGVYSFCMCPGGYVVNASSEPNRLSINGMSYYNRDSENANSAIVVTITPDDFGHHPLDGINYQRHLEEKTFELGRGNIPIQLLKDFQENRETTNLGQVKPLFKGTYSLSNLHDLLPSEVTKSLLEAFPNFGKKITGFDNPDTILAALESRTSSPVRIERNDDFESNIRGVYPCGEGAGYAGGITSAALDGLKVAESLANKYQPFNK